MIKLYHSRGLTVEEVIGDNKFECVKEEIQPVMLNIAAVDEHVSPDEQLICTIKEHTRYQIQHLPYGKHPKVMVLGCVMFVTKALNNKVGMSTLSIKTSLNALVTGQ